MNMCKNYAVDTISDSLGYWNTFCSDFTLLEYEINQDEFVITIQTLN